MLIPLIFAAAVAGQPPAPAPVADAPADKPQATARQIVEQQLASRPGAVQTAPQSGDEATAVQAAYLKSIGHRLRPANDSFGSPDSPSGSGAAGPQ
jgi:hypothetical protein